VAVPSIVDSVEPPSTPKRGRRMLILVGVAVAAAGFAAAVVYGPTSLRILQEKDVTLAPPAQTAGLTRDTSAAAEETADYLRTAISAGMQLDTSVGTVYTDPADASRSVIFAGGTTVLRAPETDLDRVFTFVAEGGAIEGLAEVPPGPLGGVMKCGTSATAEGTMAICAWADHGSIALALFPGRRVDDAAQVFRTMRGDIQHRS
jgi:hypothetical protein